MLCFGGGSVLQASKPTLNRLPSLNAVDRLRSLYGLADVSEEFQDVHFSHPGYLCLGTLLTILIRIEDEIRLVQ